MRFSGSIFERSIVTRYCNCLCCWGVSMGQLLRTQRRSLIVLLLILTLVISVAQGVVQHLIAHPQHHGERDKSGAVASENKICSQIGIDLLKMGGNAADAVSSAYLSNLSPNQCTLTTHRWSEPPSASERSTCIIAALGAEALCSFDCPTVATRASISGSLHRLPRMKICSMITLRARSLEV